MALTSGLSEGLGILGLFADALLPASLALYTDSNAGRQTCCRTGVERVKHLDVRYLLIQLLLKQRQFELRRIPGVENPADVLTKNVSREVIEKLRTALHLVPTALLINMLSSKTERRSLGRELAILSCTSMWSNTNRNSMSLRQPGGPSTAGRHLFPDASGRRKVILIA